MSPAHYSFFSSSSSSASSSSSSSPASKMPTIPQCILLSLLACLSVHVTGVSAKPASPTAAAGHADEKRFYIPVIISSDAILASLKDPVAQEEGGGGGSGSGRQAFIRAAAAENSLNRKRTAAARLEYFDSLMPRSIQPKRRMFYSPLGYMSASARRLNQSQQGNREAPSREDEGSAGFRYG